MHTSPMSANNPQSASSLPTATLKQQQLEQAHIVDRFCTLPKPAQTVVLRQITDRLDSSQLQFVYSLVSPRLCVDPFDELPIEIALNTLRHLDVPTLLEASRTCHKWNYL